MTETLTDSELFRVQLEEEPMNAKGQIIGVDKPAVVKHGEPIAVTVTAKNIGDITTTYNLRMFFGTTLKLIMPTFTLVPGATKTQTLTQPAPTTGTEVIVKIELDIYTP